MAEGDIGAVIDSLVFDAVFCNFPTIIHISGDVYAVVYRDTDAFGRVSTFTINSAGEIGDAVIDTLKFYGGTIVESDMVRVSGDFYAIAFEGTGSDGYVRTVEIDSSGNIGAAWHSSLVINATQCKGPKIIHVAGTTYAIVYSGQFDDGFLTTITISGGGVITDPVIETREFMITDCIDPDILNVDGEIFAIAYRGTDADGFVSTIEITAAGDIADAVIETLEFDTATCYQPELAHVAGSTFAVAYQGITNYGTIKTFTISAAGDIGAAVVDTFVFDAATGRLVDVVGISGGFVGIVYQGVGADGHLCTFSIDADGTINDGTLQTFEFDESDCSYPSFIHISGSLYAIAYVNTGNDGTVKTVEIETIIGGAISQLTFMGIG